MKNNEKKIAILDTNILYYLAEINNLVIKDRNCIETELKKFDEFKVPQITILEILTNTGIEIEDKRKIIKYLYEASIDLIPVPFTVGAFPLAINKLFSKDFNIHLANVKKHKIIIEKAALKFMSELLLINFFVYHYYLNLKKQAGSDIEGYLKKEDNKKLFEKISKEFNSKHNLMIKELDSNIDHILNVYYSELSCNIDQEYKNLIKSKIEEVYDILVKYFKLPTRLNTRNHWLGPLIVVDEVDLEILKGIAIEFIPHEVNLSYIDVAFYYIYKALTTGKVLKKNDAIDMTFLSYFPEYYILTNDGNRPNNPQGLVAIIKSLSDKYDTDHYTILQSFLGNIVK